METADWQKHFGLILDSKLNFNEHIENKITKCNKILRLLKKFPLTLSSGSLLTIYKSFVRPNLDYADIIYYKTLNESFKKKIRMVQYSTTLTITGVFKGTLRVKYIKSLVLNLWQIENRP